MRVLVTGGAGFIGSALVKALVATEEDVLVLDNFFRGNRQSLPKGVELCEGDVTNLEDVCAASVGVDEIIHLAYINGTELFYKMPATVLDVAVRGILSVLDACTVNEVPRLMLMSSSEVCRAEVGRMNETVPLVIPDPYNPRYSYSAGKIISEMLAIHSNVVDWLTIVRPYNIYGPGMSEGHVIPDFRKRIEDSLRTDDGGGGSIAFTMAGSQHETRSFCYIDDFIDGVMLVRSKGEHRGIYNVGTPEEVSIGDLAQLMAEIYKVHLLIYENNSMREGSIARRKPDISKLQKLGYQPKVSLEEGLRRVLCQ